MKRGGLVVGLFLFATVLSGCTGDDSAGAPVDSEAPPTDTTTQPADAADEEPAVSRSEERVRLYDCDGMVGYFPVSAQDAAARVPANLTLVSFGEFSGTATDPSSATAYFFAFECALVEWVAVSLDDDTAVVEMASEDVGIAFYGMTIEFEPDLGGELGFTWDRLLIDDPQLLTLLQQNGVPAMEGGVSAGPAVLGAVSTASATSPGFAASVVGVATGTSTQVDGFTTRFAILDDAAFLGTTDVTGYTPTFTEAAGFVQGNMPGVALPGTPAVIGFAQSEGLAQEWAINLWA